MKYYSKNVKKKKSLTLHEEMNFCWGKDQIQNAVQEQKEEELCGCQKGYGSSKEYEETQIKEDVIFVKMKRMSNTHYWTVQKLATGE